jgi:ArsR family transcriptional regulator
MTELLPIFKSLADESRLRIVHALSHSTFNVQELTSILELSQPTISHHLKILQQAHLVSVSRQATWAYYSLPTTLSDTHSTEQDDVKQILKSFEK